MKSKTLSAALIITLLATVAYVAKVAVLTPRVWEGRFFANREMRGDYRRFDTRKIMYFSGLPRLPDERTTEYSAAFYSCLTLQRGASLDFELGSDDGSKLQIDGVTALDNWERHGNRAVSGRLNVAPGVHLLTVAYFQGGGDSSLFFKFRVENGPMLVSSPLLSMPVNDGEGRPQCHRS